MDLPVYLNGERVGEVSLSPHERHWRARLQMADIGRVARLSLYGRGESVYLGIPEPDGHGAMTLTRTLRALPEGLEYAAERPNAPAPQRREKEREKSADAPRHVVWMGGRPYYF